MKIQKLVKRILPEILWNPIWLTDRKLACQIKKEIKNQKIKSGDNWLDVGCGEKRYEKFFTLGTYTGLDVRVSGRPSELKQADVYYDGGVFPFKPNQFNGVMCTQVLEHVPEPKALIQQIQKVLKKDGHLVLTLPFVWQEHEKPYDFFRFSRHGIRDLLEKSGFSIEEIRPLEGSIETIAIMMNVYITNNLVPFNNSVLSLLINIILCMPIQILALFFSKIFPDQGYLYLNLLVLAKKC
jgi:SAM-dependent methyltransferase